MSPEIERQEAEDELTDSIREVGAMSMRIIRGAGDPIRLLANIDRAATAIAVLLKYEKSIGPGLVRSALDIPLFEPSYTLGNEFYVANIVSGSLQIVASQLLHQKTQEYNGRNEMQRGLDAWKERMARATRSP